MSTSAQSTGSYPCYMLFGKEMPLPIDVALWPNELLDKAPRNYLEGKDYPRNCARKIK